jgi:hypothetical protein
MTSSVGVGFALAAVAQVLAVPAAGAGEPRVELRFAAFGSASFPNFTSVLVPAEYGRLEIWVQDALGEIDVSTVRVRLNELPMTPFVAVNRLPRGVRLLLKEGLTLNPEHRLRPTGENVLSVFAQDATRTAYQGHFYLSIDPALAAPRAAGMRARAPVREVTAPEQKAPPTIAFTSEWPKRTDATTLALEAEATDAEGISRLVIEVNGKDTDEVVMQNNIPVRKHAGWMSRGKAPGEITGDSLKLIVKVPIRLEKGLTVVAIRAENSMGLSTRLDRVVERLGR